MQKQQASFSDMSAVVVTEQTVIQNLFNIYDVMRAQKVRFTKFYKRDSVSGSVRFCYMLSLSEGIDKDIVEHVDDDGLKIINDSCAGITKYVNSFLERMGIDKSELNTKSTASLLCETIRIQVVTNDRVKAKKTSNRVPGCAFLGRYGKKGYTICVSTKDFITTIFIM